MKEVAVKLENVSIEWVYILLVFFTEKLVQEHKKQMEAAMDNLESVQKSHQKEIVQIQDACNQQGTVILGVALFDWLPWQPRRRCRHYRS